LLGSDARRGLKDHPTVKPTALPEDALLDVSDRGEIVIDPFLGSGSTLIAAQATGRVCRGVELDPLYVDVIVRRYEAATGNHAVLVETGETLDLLAARTSVCVCLERCGLLTECFGHALISALFFEGSCGGDQPSSAKRKHRKGGNNGEAWSSRAACRGTGDLR
jgi:hypothetical protein